MLKGISQLFFCFIVALLIFLIMLIAPISLWSRANGPVLTIGILFFIIGVLSLRVSRSSDSTLQQTLRQDVERLTPLSPEGIGNAGWVVFVLGTALIGLAFYMGGLPGF